MPKKRLTSDRGEALTCISASLNELYQIAASHRLHLLGYLLGMAYIESCDMVRRERAHDRSKVVDPGKTAALN